MYFIASGETVIATSLVDESSKLTDSTESREEVLDRDKITNLRTYVDKTDGL
jgi:hypothetical protein